MVENTEGRAPDMAALGLARYWHGQRHETEAAWVEQFTAAPAPPVGGQTVLVGAFVNGSGLCFPSFVERDGERSITVYWLDLHGRAGSARLQAGSPRVFSRGHSLAW